MAESDQLKGESMNAGWAVPIGGAITFVLGAATVSSTMPQGHETEWITTLAAMGGIVTIISSAVNAFFNRSIKLAIMERVDSVKSEVLKSVDAKLDRISVELARKDLTDERFRGIERRVLLVEKSERDDTRRAAHRGDGQDGE